MRSNSEAGADRRPVHTPAGRLTVMERAAQDWERQRVWQGDFGDPRTGAAEGWPPHQRQSSPYVDWAGRGSEAWKRPQARSPERGE